MNILELLGTMLPESQPAKDGAPPRETPPEEPQKESGGDGFNMLELAMLRHEQIVSRAKRKGR